MYKETLYNVPVNSYKIWTLVKTAESLIIYCNEVEVLNMRFRDRVKLHYTECYSKWSQVVSHITIVKGVTEYRKGGEFQIMQLC